jgi:hypothetical protein
LQTSQARKLFLAHPRPSIRQAARQGDATLLCCRLPTLCGGEAHFSPGIACAREKNAPNAHSAENAWRRANKTADAVF